MSRASYAIAHIKHPVPMNKENAKMSSGESGEVLTRYSCLLMRWLIVSLHCDEAGTELENDQVGIK